MSSEPVFAQPQHGRWIVFAALIAAGAALIAFGWKHRGGGQAGPIPSPAPAGMNTPATALATSPVPDQTAPPPAPIRPEQKAQYAWFQLRPLGVARESADYQWTAEDGKDPGVIQKLAHNDLEFQRMADENSRILRRQLVYHKETTDALVQRAKQTGESLRQLTLPGLDGQEVRVEITRTDLSSSGQQGAFAGQVAGRPDSTVTLAFKGGREAFTILSPADGLYLQGDPREPGELVVKSINPDTYVLGTCGTP
jgi:hypothetical protein